MKFIYVDVYVHVCMCICTCLYMYNGCTQGTIKYIVAILREGVFPKIFFYETKRYFLVPMLIAFSIGKKLLFSLFFSNQF